MIIKSGIKSLPLTAIEYECQPSSDETTKQNKLYSNTHLF